MKKAEIKIKWLGFSGSGKDVGEKTISAYINEDIPGLAIHHPEGYPSGWWVITHLKSGKAMPGVFHRLGEAEDYIISLSIMKPKSSRKPINWMADEATILKQFENLSKANRAIVRCVE